MSRSAGHGQHVLPPVGALGPARLDMHRVAGQAGPEGRAVGRNGERETVAGRNHEQVGPAPGQLVHHEVAPRAGVLQQRRISGPENIGARVERIPGIPRGPAGDERGAGSGQGIGQQRERRIGKERGHRIGAALERHGEPPVVQRGDRHDAAKANRGGRLRPRPPFGGGPGGRDVGGRGRENQGPGVSRAVRRPRFGRGRTRRAGAVEANERLGLDRGDDDRILGPPRRHDQLPRLAGVTGGKDASVGRRRRFRRGGRRRASAGRGPERGDARRRAELPTQPDCSGDHAANLNAARQGPGALRAPRRRRGCRRCPP